MCTKKDANLNGSVQRMMEALPLSTTKWRRWTQRPGVGFLVVVQLNQVSDRLQPEIIHLYTFDLHESNKQYEKYDYPDSCNFNIHINFWYIV